MKFLADWLAQHPELRQLVTFFQENLTLIDFVIVIFGCFLLLFQLNLFLFNTKGAYFRKAQKVPLYTKKVSIYLSYVAGSIEMLPFLGILGTVVGLMQALFTLKLETHPTITMMAAAVAPALSSTLLGLIFATLNLFFFNVLRAYFEEIYARFNLGFNDYVQKTLLLYAHRLTLDEKKRLELVLAIPSDARIYDEETLLLIQKIRETAKAEIATAQAPQTLPSNIKPATEMEKTPLSKVATEPDKITPGGTKKTKGKIA